jgi:eukaryotic-like serine/threonine-protein kinase
MPDSSLRLSQRKIVQWAIAYLAGAWVLLQVLEFIAGNFGWPPALVRAATVFLAIGFGAALVIAWYHGEQGRQQVTRTEIVLLSLILLGAGAGAVATYRTPEAAGKASAAHAAPVGALTTVAVLPFENTSADPQDEYFSDGMTDELAHALGQIPQLRVAGRTSSYAFKGKAVPVPEIGKALDVAGVIAGTVRRSGAQLRVTAQLANTSDGKVVWTHTYQSGQTDVFVVQDSFTQAIVSALLPHLRGTAAASAAEQGRGTTNQTAYDLYLRGRYFWAKRGPDNLDRAADYFKRAIAEDPRFARAHAALAMTYGVLPTYRADPANAMRPLVQQSAGRALALDATLADAHLAMGLAYERDLRLVDSEAEYRAAIRLDPSSPSAYQWLGETMQAVGRIDEALTASARAAELDPLSAVVATSRGTAHVQARKFREAVIWLRRGLELDPTFTWASMNLAVSQVFLGHADSAVALLEPIYKREPTAQGLAGVLLFAYAAANRWENAQRLRSALHRPGGDESGGVQAAYAELIFGDAEPLLDLLERPGSLRLFYDTFAWFGCNPMFEPLSKEPRFVAAVKPLNVEFCSLASPWPVHR